METQAKVMELLRRELGAQTSLVKWLEATLNIEYSAAYRKAHCASHLKLDELAAIYRECPAVNAVWPARDREERIIVKQNSFAHREDIQSYLTSVKEQLQKALYYKMTLQYFARDYPLFLFFAEPALFEYKMSMWTHEMAEEGIQKWSHELQQLRQEIFELYRQLPSQEIWFAKAMQNQMDQLQWHLSIGAVNAEECKTIRTAFLKTLHCFKDWALRGSKREDGEPNYHLHSRNT